MIEARTFRIACSAGLVLAGFVGLVAGVELALRGHDWSIWVGGLFLSPVLAFCVFVAMAFAYRRALRRSILKAAEEASDPNQCRNVLHRLKSSEVWVGPLRLRQMEEAMEKKSEELRRAL
jgi:hypothetical protein